MTSTSIVGKNALSRTSPFLLMALAVGLITACATSDPSVDPLPSWNDGEVKQAIIHFVTSVTTKDGPDFVPPEQRIATFDNDGTLWCYQFGMIGSSDAHTGLAAVAEDNFFSKLPHVEPSAHRTSGIMLKVTIHGESRSAWRGQE